VWEWLASRAGTANPIVGSSLPLVVSDMDVLLRGQLTYNLHRKCILHADVVNPLVLMQILECGSVLQIWSR
jgi:hypothetical protein